MRQTGAQTMDKRAIAGMVGFLGLTAMLGLAVPFSLDSAQANTPLKQAIMRLMN
jgi:hypothetical protein